MQFLQRQIRDLENERNRRLRRDDESHVAMMRELASLAGLTPTPFASSSIDREQGISKAGNKRMRRMMVELAWCWLRYQPTSELSQWYLRRFGRGSARLRKIGIVAVARKLLIALWRYVTWGEVPTGAEFGSWHKKVSGRIPKYATAREAPSRRDETKRSPLRDLGGDRVAAARPADHAAGNRAGAARRPARRSGPDDAAAETPQERNATRPRRELTADGAAQ